MDYKRIKTQYGELFEKQLELEAFYKGQAEEQKEAFLNSQNLAETSVAHTLIKHVWGDALENIKALIELVVKPKVGVKPAYTPCLKYLISLWKSSDDLAETLTLLTLHTVLSRFHTSNLAESTLSSTVWAEAKLLVNEVKLQAFTKSLSDHEDYKKLASITIGLSKRIGEAYRTEYVMKRMLHEGFTAPCLDRTLLQRLVVKLIEVSVVSTGLFTIETTTRFSTKNASSVLSTQLVPTEWLAEAIQGLTKIAIDGAVLRCACIIPPKPWTGVFNSGGYYGALQKYGQFIRQDFSDSNAYTKMYRKRLEQVDLSYVFAALNTVQATPYKVNIMVFKFISALYRNGDGKGGWGGVPTLTFPVMPPKLPEGASEDAIREHKDILIDIYKKRPKILSKRLRFESIFHAAQRYSEYANIYFPHNIDYRGRIYPLPTDLHPQGDDLMKGLLLYSKPTPCKSKHDLDWLMIAGANHAAFNGLDKKPFDERIKWVKDNISNITQSADDPMNFKWWWSVSQDEHPVCFLAFCYELSDALKYINEHGSIIGYKCSIPIPFDGSCSGLQHFSALLRDSTGGKAVNLVPTDEVQDIYTEVLNHVNACLHKDVLKGTSDKQKKVAGGEAAITYGTKFLANQWITFAKDEGDADGNLKRHVVKRSVMTLAYGSGEYGFKNNILSDILRPYTDNGGTAFDIGVGAKSSVFPAAVYLAKLINRAVSAVVQKAVEGMDFLQKMSTLITKSNDVVHWVTPNGLPVQQRMMKTNSYDVRVRIAGMQYRVYVQDTSDDIDKRKQRNAISPNFIHSLDASHMQRVLVEAHKEGMTNFQMIHDSFATDLGNTDRFFHIIREQFVKLYDGSNYLKDFVEQVTPLIDAKCIADLPAIPAMGTLDIKGVLDSKYSFA